ncbi:hypothetical protein HGO97_018095 [Faecalicatena sp. AGMB00832]|uniref:Uncharacterized protein n=1 Tax=Faecalicatena faecalis TaxID=2726362 RepID=A0ABS6D801_9FIRM|nr:MULTISPECIES: hypothetical protein [Faecalicatena]MBU3877719.1 hypothetical protein [Faecalicatena faecalis]MCI6466180.1 hypothetical protein [Faecalicatena sp.]MDY5619346.1 hypothetical protein [Lachnospiraceae bacterium]
MQTYDQFNNKIHKLGITTTLILGVLFLMVPLGITLAFGVSLDWKQILTVSAPIALIFGITGLCEKLSMAPVIGSGAVYLASATGNVQNMKLPAALNAMRVMDCEEGSEKGRVVSIIAVATSAFVTTLIVFTGMLFLAPMVAPLLSNPHVAPAFDNMFPALLGPLVLPVLMKNFKASILPFGLAIVFAAVLGPRYGQLQSIVMVVVILLSIGGMKVIMSRKEKQAEML